MVADSALRLALEAKQPGSVNMERDTAAMHAVAAGETAGMVRIYGFAPACLTLGRLQEDAEVDWAACQRDGVDVVRRPTGGRAILHDAEVTYAVTCRADDPSLGGDVATSYARIHTVIAVALRRMGVITHPVARHDDERSEAHARAAIADCFARPASHELVDIDGRKLVGSAQARYGDALLQHGSILLMPPRAAEYFVTPEAATRPATKGVIGLLRREVSYAELAEVIAVGFAQRLGARLVAD